MDSKYNFIADEESLSLGAKLGAYFGEERLIKASNKGTYKRALKDLGGAGDIPLSAEGEALRAEIAGEKVLLKKDISDCECGCAAKTVCRHIIAAAAAVNTLADSQTQPEEEKPEEKEVRAEAPDTEYLSELKETARNILAKGLVNCSQADAETLDRLALKGGARYAAAANVCRSCGEEIRLMNARHAGFSPARAAGLVCRLFNTAEALEGGKEDVLKKSGFSREGSGEFVCAGAFPWKTESGYAGVTAVLYEIDLKEFFTYASVMPSFYESTANAGSLRNLLRLMNSRSHWQNDVSISSLVGRRFTLMNYKADERRRLSSTKRTSCVIKERMTEGDLPEELCIIPERAEYDYFSRAADERFFTVRSPQFTGAVFDKAMQGLHYGAAGENALLSDLWLKYEETNEKAIRFIEMNSGERPKDGLLLMRIFGGRIYPISMISGETVTDIFF